MISVADLQLYIGALEDGTDSETLLEEIEERAVALVERATGRYFGASGSVTWLLDGGGGYSLYLQDDVTAVATVSYRGAVWEEFVALDVTTGYVLDSHRMRLLRVDGSEWPDGTALVQVTATRGYATGAEPPPIRQLVLDLVNFHYRTGRKLFLEEGGSPDPSKVPGWDRVVNLYRAPLYG